MAKLASDVDSPCAFPGTKACPRTLSIHFPGDRGLHGPPNRRCRAVPRSPRCGLHASTAPPSRLAQRPETRHRWSSAFCRWGSGGSGTIGFFKSPRAASKPGQGSSLTKSLTIAPESTRIIARAASHTGSLRAESDVGPTPKPHGMPRCLLEQATRNSSSGARHALCQGALGPSSVKGYRESATCRLCAELVMPP